MKMDPTENPYKCSAGEECFRSTSLLASHISIHLGQIPFKNDIIDKFFRTNGNLTTHVLVHKVKEDSLHRCEICDKAFKRKSNLNKHIKIHTGERPFECDVCYKRFSRSDTLNTHKLTHAVRSVFNCDICRTTFPYKEHLIKHKKTHFDMTYDFNKTSSLFQCIICEKVFSRTGNLKKHLRLVHKSETKEKQIKLGFSIDSIETGLATKRESQFHIEEGIKIEIEPHVKEEIIENDEFEEVVENDTFDEEDEFIKVLEPEINLYQEDIEDRKDTELDNEDRKDTKYTASQQDRDIQLIPPMERKYFRSDNNDKSSDIQVKIFQCDICDSSFNLRKNLTRHYKIHTGERPFECDICNKRFSRPDTLKKHIRIVHKIIIPGCFMIEPEVNLI